MTETTWRFLARVLVGAGFLGAANAFAVPPIPGASSTSQWGCCPGCMNGGPLGPDGTPTGGATPASVPAPAVAPKRVAAPKAGPDGVVAVDFALLAGYDYTPPAADASPLAGVAEAVRALDGRRVRVTGFMLPLEMKDGRCRQFLILRNQAACCYGQSPLPTEWIIGTSAKGVTAEQDTPLNFAGLLRVGARFDNGIFSGVYSLEVQDEPTR